MTIFETDLFQAREELQKAKRKGYWLRLLTFNICNNSSQIKKIENLVNKYQKQVMNYNSFLDRAKEIDDEILQTVKIEDVRISKNTFADFPAITSSGYPRNWEQLRLMVLTRDNYQCQKKDPHCDGPLQIHHKISLSKGGSNKIINLQTLCLYHHCCIHPHMRDKYYGNIWS